jgi:starch phosphorylase
MWPDKFLNVTNGITPRRWLLACNPSLAKLIEEITSHREQLWTNLDLLADLRSHADNPDLQAQWMDIKYENKRKLAKYLREHLKIDVDPKALFDIQVKRIHEYKARCYLLFLTIYRDNS